jgi:Zn-dependent peptidase ImmA (M78 family)
MVALLETHGVVVTRFETKTRYVDAFSCWMDERPYVFLASDKSSGCRSRFDAAHELGHIILHRAIDQDDILDKRTRDRIEAEANRFAGAFLVPEETFTAEFYSTRVEHLKGLKKRWRVSMAALCHRAKQLGAIDEYQYIQFRKQLSYHKWLTREPLDDEIAIEEPKLLAKAWRLLIDRGVLGETAFDDKLGFSAEWVQRLSGLVPTPRAADDVQVSMR